MSEAVHLYIITDNPTEAALTLLGCRVSSLPSWMKVVSDPFEVEALSSGSAAIGLFFPSDMRKPAFVETVWRERRVRGGIDCDREKHLDKLAAWMRRRDEAEARIIADALEHEKQIERGEAA